MPDSQYKEVLIVLIACMVLFLTLAAIILLFLYLYQRRRYLQRQQLVLLQQQYTEQTLQAQLEIQEQTFIAIGQEIHDNVGQVLSLVKVQVNIIHETERIDMQLLQAMRDNISNAMTDLRDLSRSLNSERIRSSDIHEVAQQEAERINRTGIMRAEVAVEGTVKEMQPEKKLILFRIIQESLQNCIKHAEASRVSICCRYLEDEIQITILDNGKGFDPEAVSGNGQGLGNIHARVRLTGGTHRIQSRVNEGTLINITIPYE
jgi:two-component system, NarL family, sensor kinase